MRVVLWLSYSGWRFRLFFYVIAGCRVLTTAFRVIYATMRSGENIRAKGQHAQQGHFKANAFLTGIGEFLQQLYTNLVVQLHIISRETPCQFHQALLLTIVIADRRRNGLCQRQAMQGFLQQRRQGYKIRILRGSFFDLC